MPAIGYLIRHRTLKGCVATIILPWAKMPPAPDYGVGGKCPVCMVPHQFKTYHLDLTPDGTCVVSKAVFDNLCRAGAIDGVPANGLGAGVLKPLTVPFEFVEEIEPPPLSIGFSRNPEKPAIKDGEGRVLRSRAPRVYRVHQDFN